MSEIKVLTTFISSWAWTIISVIFLTAGSLFVKGDFDSLDLVIGAGFFSMFIICFYIGLKRKKEVIESE